MHKDDYRGLRAWESKCWRWSLRKWERRGISMRVSMSALVQIWIAHFFRKGVYLWEWLLLRLSLEDYSASSMSKLELWLFFLQFVEESCLLSLWLTKELSTGGITRKHLPKICKIFWGVFILKSLVGIVAPFLEDNWEVKAPLLIVWPRDPGISRIYGHHKEDLTPSIFGIVDLVCSSVCEGVLTCYLISLNQSSGLQ